MTNKMGSPRNVWTNIESTGKDQFILKQTDQEDQIYNGQLISQAMYCGYQTVPQLFDINSFHSYFVRKVNSLHPINFHVKRIRDGRNFVFRVVQLMQQNEVIYHCEFTFRKRPEKADLKITQARFPSVPEPQRLKSLDELKEDFDKQGYNRLPYNSFKDIEFNAEIRPCNGMELLLGPQRPTLKLNVWIRYKPENFSNDPNHNCLALAYLSDIGLMYTGALPFPKAAFQILSSIDHSGWLHEPNFNCNEFMLLEQECLMYTNGKSLVHSRLWTQKGDLIASFSQETSVKRVEPIKSIAKSKL